MIVEAILMHDPVRLLAMRGSAFVEDERLPHADPFEACVDDLVAPCGLPETGSRCPVGSGSSRILLVLVAEEIPVVLWRGANPAFVCTSWIINMRIS